MDRNVAIKLLARLYGWDAQFRTVLGITMKAKPIEAGCRAVILPNRLSGGETDEFTWLFVCVIKKVSLEFLEEISPGIPRTGQWWLVTDGDNIYCPEESLMRIDEDNQELEDLETVVLKSSTWKQ